jgi:RNA polymerase sigma-70 factor (ECF subfamily)
MRQCSNRALAEELFQDVWMNLVRSRSVYTVQAKFTTYVYRIAHNRLIDHYRTQKGVAIASFDDEDGPSLDDIPAKRSDDPAVSAESKQQAAGILKEGREPASRAARGILAATGIGYER